MKVKINIEFELNEDEGGSNKNEVIEELRQWLSYPNEYDLRRFISNVNIVEEREQTNKIKLKGFAQSDPFVPVHYDLDGE